MLKKPSPLKQKNWPSPWESVSDNTEFNYNPTTLEQEVLGFAHDQEELELEIKKAPNQNIIDENVKKKKEWENKGYINPDLKKRKGEREEKEKGIQYVYQQDHGLSRRKV